MKHSHRSKEPDVIRHFDKFSSEARAERAASHKLGHRQKEMVGEYFWTHKLIPNIAFASRKEAIIAGAKILKGLV